MEVALQGPDRERVDTLGQGNQQHRPSLRGRRSYVCLFGDKLSILSRRWYSRASSTAAGPGPGIHRTAVGGPSRNSRRLHGLCCGQHSGQERGEGRASMARVARGRAGEARSRGWRRRWAGWALARRQACHDADDDGQANMIVKVVTADEYDEATRRMLRGGEEATRRRRGVCRTRRRGG